MWPNPLDTAFFVHCNNSKISKLGDDTVFCLVFSKNEFLAIAVKKYTKVDIRVFLFGPILLDFLIF